MNFKARTIIAVICILSLIHSALAQTRVQAGHVVETTVCAISRTPDHFNGKIVRLAARLESDGMDWTVLTDKDCKYGGMAIDMSGKFSGSDDLANALSSKSPGTIDKTITGVFIGRFEWRPNQVPARILHLKELHELKVMDTVAH